MYIEMYVILESFSSFFFFFLRQKIEVILESLILTMFKINKSQSLLVYYFDFALNLSSLRKL